MKHFVDALDLAGLGFERVEPAAREARLSSFGFGSLEALHLRLKSSRRLERKAGRNLELLWLLGRLAPDHKTIADFHSWRS